MIRLTREFSFESSHALSGYDGACSQIHGHSYRLFVTIKGEPSTDESDPKLGMVMDFGTLKGVVKKNVIDRLDHTLVLNEKESALIAQLRARFERVLAVPFQPTCENLIVWIAARIKPELPKNVELFSLRLHETANSYAEWFASEN